MNQAKINNPPQQNSRNRNVALQFDPTGNVINLSIKTFSIDVFKLLNENSNFVTM